MKKIGEFIINRKQACKITEIKEMKGKLYYSLEPVEDPSLKLLVPVDSEFLREVMTKEETLEFLETLGQIEIIKSNEKMIENEYKELMNRGTQEDLIKVIKTTYLRNKDRMDRNKKISDKDNEYFLQAEKYLYNEVSIALDLSYDEAKEYVVRKLKEANQV